MPSAMFDWLRERSRTTISLSMQLLIIKGKHAGHEFPQYSVRLVV